MSTSPEPPTRSTSPSSSPEPASRDWTPTQNHTLLRLRDAEKLPWSTIASTMNRTIPSVSAHYYALIQAREGSRVDWTSQLDHTLIDLRRRGLAMKAIATQMCLPTQAVQDRWYTLVRTHQVPDDVLALWKRKGDVVWSESEDEKILEL